MKQTGLPLAVTIVVAVVLLALLFSNNLSLVAIMTVMIVLLALIMVFGGASKDLPVVIKSILEGFKDILRP
jgi:hypothetical protein